MRVGPTAPSLDEDHRSTLARAIETDRGYFELGAELQLLPGATLAWMTGLATSPAGAVVHRVDPDTIAEQGSDWIAQVERPLAAAGAGLARIYLDGPHAGAGKVLQCAGYAPRDELVFVGSQIDPPSGMTLRRVESDGDWRRKLEFHELAQATPDGHRNNAAQWVELERRKCAAGMVAYLAEVGGRVVGAVGAVEGEQLLRIKNLVVHPSHRGCGLGRAMLGAMAGIGRAKCMAHHCTMAVKGDDGERFYHAIGMEMIGLQVEWSKPIGWAQ